MKLLPIILTSVLLFLLSCKPKLPAILISDPSIITNAKAVDSLIYYLLKSGEGNISVDSLSITKDGVFAKMYVNDKGYKYYHRYVYSKENLESLINSEQYVKTYLGGSDTYSHFTKNFETINQITYWWQKAIEHK